jgi:hypothetical protein
MIPIMMIVVMLASGTMIPLVAFMTPVPIAIQVPF